MWDSKSYERKGILARVAFEFYIPQEICVKVWISTGLVFFECGVLLNNLCGSRLWCSNIYNKHLLNLTGDLNIIIQDRR